MTNEEAIKILDNNRYFVPVESWHYEYNEAIDMAIEALSSDVEIPSDQTVVHIETYRKLYEKYVELKHASANIIEFDFNKYRPKVRNKVNDGTPSADAVHGEWVEKEVMVDEDTNITEWQSARCSVCGKYHTTPFMYYFDDFNFCPNCGARMYKGGAE